MSRLFSLPLNVWEWVRLFLSYYLFLSDSTGSTTSHTCCTNALIQHAGAARGSPGTLLIGIVLYITIKSHTVAAAVSHLLCYWVYAALRRVQSAFWLKKLHCRWHSMLVFENHLTRPLGDSLLFALRLSLLQSLKVLPSWSQSHGCFHWSFEPIPHFTSPHSSPSNTQRNGSLTFVAFL